MSVDFPSLQSTPAARRSLVRPLLAATVAGLLVSELFVIVGMVQAGLFGYVLVLAVGVVAGTADERGAVLLVPATIASWRLVVSGVPEIGGIRPVTIAYVGALVGVFALRTSGVVSVEHDAPSVARGAVGAALGVGLGVVAVIAFGRSLSTLSLPSTPAAVAILLGVVLLLSIVDELLFRRLFQPALGTAFDPAVAIVAVSLLYGFVAPATGQFTSLPLAIVAGALFGLAYELTHDVEAVVALHAGVLVGLVVAPVAL